MTENYKQQLSTARQAFELSQSETVEIRKKLFGQSEKLIQLINRYEESWIGDWVRDPDSYWKNFDQSSNEIMRSDEKYIMHDIEKNTKIDLVKLKKEIQAISRRFFKLKDFILSELSFIKSIEIFNNEAELLIQIENFQWGTKCGDYIRSRHPKQFFVSDLTFMNQGRLPVPPHIAVADEIFFLFSRLTSYDHFETLVRRFLRQLEIKSSINLEEASVVFQQQALRAIIDKFHSVVTQIKNRYDGRPTISINDEYDVQDVMNALLRINFEDVRKEEYTPSYAGGSTRIDFLLKREKILIEVKKTRANLKDKEVGNQLIIDIAHYKSHPDCKHLICFVYDPDNLIVNPRGLEDDLSKNTTDDMIVEVYVRP